MKESKGLTVTTKEPDVIAAIDHFSDQLLRLGKEVDDIVAAADRFPKCPLLQIYAAIVWSYAQTAEGDRSARTYLSRAHHHENEMNEREKNLLQAIDFWNQRKMSAALAHLEKHCRAWPNDLIALKVTEFMYYCKGQYFEGSRFLETTQFCLPHNAQDGLFLSMHAFAQELTGHYQECRITAERALSLDDENPWAQHALSHFYMNQGLIEDGLRFFGHYAPTWCHYNRLIASHNMWHYALLYLENLDFENVKEIYLRADWKHQAAMIGEEVDATALLWRLDMENVECNELWNPLANHINDHASYCTIPFVSAHLAYALKRGNRIDALEDALAHIKRFVLEQEGEDRMVWEEVGLPLVFGSLAFADKKFTEALKHLDPMIGRVGAVGGSDAQVDLFNQTYFKCLIGSKRFSDAKNFLDQLTSMRNKTPLEQSWDNQCS